VFRTVIAICCVLASSGICFAQESLGKPGPMPAFRVVVEGFGAGQADIRAIITSAGRELWQHFPAYKIDPIVVTRGRQGPITLFKRNDRGEIVVCLDTEKALWSQYSYQFAHEFCHVLCGYREGPRRNKWFEETLCETASLYVMRAMSRSWKKDPPYPNWKDYRDSLRNYADDVVRRRDRVYELYERGLPGFYLAHRATLEKSATVRDLNGAMSIVMLQLFEEQPARWESIRWLNATPAGDGDTFQTYLQKWHDAAPAAHQAFVRQVGQLYGVAVTAP
jgi:hypothetical protein